VDKAFVKKRRDTPRPIISLIYITKRPGGYGKSHGAIKRLEIKSSKCTISTDFLMNSLAQQDLPEGDNLYELICVDEVGPVIC
jgi:hypothetical protein